MDSAKYARNLAGLMISARQQNLYVWVLLFPFVGFLVNKVANDVFGRQLSAIGKYTFHNARVNQMGSEGAN